MTVLLLQPITTLPLPLEQHSSFSVVSYVLGSLLFPPYFLHWYIFFLLLINFYVLTSRNGYKSQKPQNEKWKHSLLSFSFSSRQYLWFVLLCVWTRRKQQTRNCTDVVILLGEDRRATNFNINNKGLLLRKIKRARVLFVLRKIILLKKYFLQ